LKFKKKIKSGVKDIRNEKNLTQQELADLVGASRQTIHYIEKGDYNPSLILAFKIADVLKTPVNSLFYRESIIKDEINSLSIGESKQITDKLSMDRDRFESLSEIREEDLLNKFSRKELQKIAKELEYSFDELFEAD